MEVLVALVLIVVIVVIAWRLRTRKPPSATAAALSQRLASARYMSGPQFEYFVADVMRGLGYRAKVLGGSEDQGVDVIATGGGKRLAIQCKQYGRPVGNKPVQEVYAGARHHRCDAAWVVAPGGFTKGAVELARSVGVTLYDARSLQMWIRQIDKRESASATLNPRLEDLANPVYEFFSEELSECRDHLYLGGVPSTKKNEEVSAPWILAPLSLASSA